MNKNQKGIGINCDKHGNTDVSSVKEPALTADSLSQIS